MRLVKSPGTNGLNFDGGYNTERGEDLRELCVS